MPFGSIGSAFYSEKKTETAWGSAGKSAVLDCKYLPWVPVHSLTFTIPAWKGIDLFQLPRWRKASQCKDKICYKCNLSLQMMGMSCMLPLFQGIWIPIWLLCTRYHGTSTPTLHIVPPLNPTKMFKQESQRTARKHPGVSVGMRVCLAMDSGEKTAVSVLPLLLDFLRLLRNCGSSELSIIALHHCFLEGNSTQRPMTWT